MIGYSRFSLYYCPKCEGISHYNMYALCLILFVGTSLGVAAPIVYVLPAALVLSLAAWYFFVPLRK